MNTIKKILSLMLTVVMLSLGAVPVLAGTELQLSNTTKVNVNSDTCYAVPTADEFHTKKDYSLHFYSEGEWLEVYQNFTEALPLGTYTLTFYAKGNGQLWFYTRKSDGNWGTLCTHTGEGGSDREEQTDGWVKYSASLTLNADGETGFFFHNNRIAMEYYIDDVSLVDANGKNYVADGGFDDVTTVNGETVFAGTTWNNHGNNNDVRYTKPALDGADAGKGYSLHFSTDGAHLEFYQEYKQPLTAGTYTLTWYAKGIGKVYFWSAWDEVTAGTLGSSDGVAEADGWTKFTREIAINGNGDTYFLFTHDDGSAVDCYFDDISLVDANGVNYIKDGGFDEVTVIETEPEFELKDYTGKLTFSDTTKIEGEQNENRYAEATCNEYYGDSGYSLHIYSEAAGFEFGQSYTVDNLPAGEYTVTWYAKGDDGKMLFSNNWGEGIYNVQITPENGADGWKKYTAKLTMDGVGDTRFLFYTDTAVDCYIDNISLVGANGVDYIKDGGFDEVTVEGLNQYAFSDKTIINGTADDFSVNATPAEKNSGSFGLHFKSSGGDGYNVTKNLSQEAVAGEKYIISFYAKFVQGQLWMRTGWGEADWIAASDSSNWTRFEKEITIGTENEASLFFFGSGATECYIDDISLIKAGSAENLVIDGGFEDVVEIKSAQKLRSFQTGDGAVTVNWTNAPWDGIRGIRVFADGEPLDGEFDLTGGAANSITVTGLTEGKTVPVEIKMYVAGEIFTANIDVTANSTPINTEFTIGEWIASKSTDASAVNFTVDNTEKASGNSSMRFDIEKNWTEGFAPYIKQIVKGVSDSNTYKLKFKSKAEDITVFYVIEESNWAQSFVIREGHEGVSDLTYDWKETEITFTPRAGATSTEIYFYVESGHGSLWIDDVSLTVVGGSNEMIKNGGFEFVDYKLSEAQFIDPSAPCDENGNPVPLTSIKEGLIEVRTKVTNYAMGNSFKPLVFVVLYDGMKLETMAYTQMQVVESIMDFGTEFCVTIDVPKMTEDTNYNLKVMYWDGLDTIRPLGGADTLN